jgi:hypothetical protein
MDRLENLAQSYTQAPWRRQLQMIGLFSLVLVFIALVAGIYLNVSARTAKMGRDIQAAQRDIDELNQEIENLQSQLAFMLSASEMENRARNLGFIEMQPDYAIYVVVPGYVERQPAVLAPHTGRAVVSAPVLPDEYTESLFEWARRRFIQTTILYSEVQP